MEKKEVLSEENNDKEISTDTLSEERKNAVSADNNNNSSNSNENLNSDEDTDTVEKLNNTESDNVLNSEDSEHNAGEKKLKKITFRKLKDKTVSVLAAFGIPDMLLIRFIGVYFLLSGINVIIMRKKEIYSVSSWQNFVLTTNIPVGIVCILLSMALLTVLFYFLPPKIRFLDKTVGILGVIFFANAVMYRTNSFYMAFGVILVSIVFLIYILGKTNISKLEKINPWFVGIAVLLVTVVVTTFLIITTVDHHKIYGTSCFDFGIFVQMFHSMKENFTAVTTCEREELLSHFKIHASFIYYALLPVYALFPQEETLLVSQVILAMGGIIPTFLIAKNYNFKGLSLFFVCLVYTFCAGIMAPCYYDFHENCFLPTLLSWLLYAVDKRNYVLFYIMSALTCIVKEDAPLYVMCIALFLFFDHKKIGRINGLIMTAVSGVYFVIITKWLTENGDGKFFASTRFGNLTIDADAGFAEVVRNSLANPGYLINLLVKEETIMFFLQIMVPLLFIPLITKKIHRHLLIIPFVIMNLIIGSGYGYAANIGYQYTFGPECLLIYMFILNCQDLKPTLKRRVPVLAGVASLITIVCVCSGNISYYENYKENEDTYIKMEECLDSIPEDASVGSNTWYLPHVADRDEVYSFAGSDMSSNPDYVTEILSYDFIVVSPGDELYTELVQVLEGLGFSEYNRVDGRVVIFQNPDYVTN